MDSTSSAREATTDMQSTQQDTAMPLNPLVPDDLLARLRGVGSRVRYNVNQGYRNDYAPPTTSTSSSGRALFRSASETLRDVYANQPIPEFKPPTGVPERKRRYSISDTLTDDASKAALTSDEASTDSLATVTPDPPTGVAQASFRPMKRLGSARRPFGKSVSLPVGSALLASTARSAPTAQPPTLAETSMEEDWSEAEFSGSGFSPVRL